MEIECHEHIGQLAREWDALADRVQAVPWLRPGWVAAWWQAFGIGTLEIFAVRRGNRLTGVLPLFHSWFGELSSTTNCHTPKFGLLAEDEAAAQALARAVFTRRRERRVILSFLAPDEAGLRECRAAAAAAGYRLLVRTLLRSPYMPIAGDWTEYEQWLGTKRLSELRRRRRQLEAQGRLWLQVEEGSERLDELLEEGLWVESSGWKDANGSAIASRPETQQFYREVARWGVERGVLRLAFLRLDGRPLAFDFCFEEGGVHYLLKTGYDPAYRKFGPGMLLRYEMLARAFSIGLVSYEFLGTDEPWKLEWTGKFHELLLFQAFAPSALGSLQWVTCAYGRPLAKRLLTMVSSRS